MLTKRPAKVIAIDANPLQLHCLELKVAAFRTLEYGEVLSLLGSRDATPDFRRHLYSLCRPALSSNCAEFWDAHRQDIGKGIGFAGWFEKHLAKFSRILHALVHSDNVVLRLFEERSRRSRARFYDTDWNTRQWRLLFFLFFSSTVYRNNSEGLLIKMLGRSSYNRLARFHKLCTVLDPADNPYVQWILTGRHKTALPFFLRAENFDNIRNNLDKIEWHCCSLERFFEDSPTCGIDRFNLSNVPEKRFLTNGFNTLLENCIKFAQKGSRIIHWARSETEYTTYKTPHGIETLTALSEELSRIDRVFLYDKVYVRIIN